MDTRERLKKITADPLLGEKQDLELRQIIQATGINVLREIEPDLRGIIERFQKKRRRDLSVALDSKIGQPQSPLPAAPTTPARAVSLDALQVEWRDRLHSLSEHHIFQWATYYRTELAGIFDVSLEAHRTSTAGPGVERLLFDEIALHSREIFRKGYTHIIRQSTGHDDAVAKSLSGLQRFLAIPVDLYTASAYSMNTASDARALRAVCSVMIAGILRGYGEVDFGKRHGWQLLPAFPRSWAHLLAFIRGDDLATIQGKIEPGDFRQGLEASVTPVLRAIDRLMEAQRGSQFCLPRFGQFVWDARRVEISLSLPRAAEQRLYLEAHCYLDAGFVKRHNIEESIGRGTSLIVAPLRPDIRDELVRPNDVLRRTVVDTEVGAGDSSATLLASLDILRFEVSKQLNLDVHSEAITTNLAKLFPLDNPAIGKYFHVYRRSIRNLLKTFETDTGVRLWCSVRRSGKTTGCVDLGASGNNSVLINQTMDNTSDNRDLDIFARRFTEALSTGRQLPSSFFSDAVIECAVAPRKEEAGRFIFILDEYETLFDHMRLAAADDQRLRYTVVQPLLNQMVAFSRQNLLIFIGQRPDSHYIILDQNQLSPYVRQDRFPLFDAAGEGITSEFDELLRKVLTERVTFDRAFAGEVYRETRGHPYLTVNVLVDFFQWMIDDKRRFSDLNLTGEDFERFAAVRLQPDAIRRSSFYEFFRQYVDQALGDLTRKQAPWLYATFTVMRRIGLKNPKTLSCSEPEFADSARDILDEFGWDADYLIKTASMANFLTVKDRQIGPAIPILGRIAMVSRPRAA